MKTLIGKTVYIAGPMRGKHCMNFAEFFYWQHEFQKNGYKVINPAEMDCLRMFNGWVFSEEKYREVLDLDKAMIRKSADFLFMLSGWEESQGANEEHNLAVELGLPVYYEELRK
jgi:hypothetical protein